jgi:NAD(P)-dependent dehydrogenase (short-subunit alcohol dehydrogenase family)
VAITGGARGLGLATAKALAARGARVALGDLDGDLALAEAAALPGGPHAGWGLDVTDHDAFRAFLDETEAELGPLDVLINNAGIMPASAFLDEDPKLTRKQIEINLIAVVDGTRMALERMLPRRRGHIVNIASIAGRICAPGVAVYTGTKHAVVGFTESVRNEHRDSGVEFSTVMPAIVNTELTSGLKPARGVKNIEAEDVAEAIVGALERPRLEVVVPRSLTPLVRLGIFGGIGLRDFLSRIFKAEESIGQMDLGARAAYQERMNRPVAADEHQHAKG